MVAPRCQAPAQGGWLLCLVFWTLTGGRRLAIRKVTSGPTCGSPVQGTPRGVTFLEEVVPLQRPSPCRVHAFFDGQNLFHSVRRAFGYTFPNCDPLRLAEAVVNLTRGRQLVQVHYYTGIPARHRDPKWHRFWSAKVRAMAASGVRVVTRVLRYVEEPGRLPDGTVQVVPVAREKGIDLRLALDLLRLARQGAFDCALIFSQDSDLAEAVQEVDSLRRELNRWLVVDCAFPESPRTWGIAGARPIRFDKRLYDTAIDPLDYF